eukprot:ctg_6260.g559
MYRWASVRSACGSFPPDLARRAPRRRWSPGRPAPSPARRRRNRVGTPPCARPWALAH